MAGEMSETIPILDLSMASDPTAKQELLKQLHAALFNVGFLYVINHDVPVDTIARLTDLLPDLFNLPAEQKAHLSKLNSPHFLGYSGFAEETTLGKQDLREQFDFATELPAIWKGSKASAVPKPNPHSAAKSLETTEEETPGPGDFDQLYWRLRGPNQWPNEGSLPRFRQALTEYHDEVEALSYRFVHLIEEAFGIPSGTFDHFFGGTEPSSQTDQDPKAGLSVSENHLPPQHRIKLLRYPPSPPDAQNGNQGVGAHKDSSGWLTFLYQVGNEPGLEVLSSSNKWIPARPIPNSFVVNFGNAFEAATEGAVKATIHRVIAPGPASNFRYSIPFFMGLPLDMTVSEVRRYIPEEVRRLRSSSMVGEQVSGFLDPRWNSLGESQLRKWIRSHKDVGEKWYGKDVVEFYTQ